MAAEGLNEDPVIQYALSLRQPPRASRGVPHSQSMHDAIRVQCGVCLLQRGRSTAGRGRWGRHLRGGEWRSRGRRSRGGGLGRFRLFRPLRWGGLRWRARRLKLRDYRIGIDRRGGGGGEIAGNTDYLHRDGNRLELAERIGDRKTGVGSGDGDGAWCPATRPEGCAGLGSLRHRLELNLHGGRGGLEVVRRERGTAGQTSSRYGNHEDTTHDRSVRHPAAAICHNPRIDHRSVGTAVQPGGSASLIDG
jgi:hypothetical protein